VSDLDSPFRPARPAPASGAHQFAERNRRHAGLRHLVQRRALRIVDVAELRWRPARSAGSFPEPAGGRPAPQSNDVTLDDRGLIYLVDRHVGL